jgi:signal peptidase I
MDKVANAEPLWIVAIILVLTLLRLALIKSKNRVAVSIKETSDTLNFVLVVAFLLIRPFVAQAFFIPSESMQSTLDVGDRLIVDKFSYRFNQPKRGDVIVFNAPQAALIAATKDINVPQSYIKRLIGLPGDKIRVSKGNIYIEGLPIDTEGKFLHDYLGEVMHVERRSEAHPNETTGIKLYQDKVVLTRLGVAKTYTKPELAQVLGRSVDVKVKIIPGQTYRNGALLDEPYTREDPDYDFPKGGGEFVVPKDQLLAFGDNRNLSSDGHIWGTLPRKNLVGRALCLFLPINRMGRIP